jgi:membrane protease subunit HflK
MASNDPGWGNGNRGKNNDGPPDLDEMMRDLTRKLNGLFGKGPKSPNGAPPSPSQPMNSGSVGLILGLIVLIWFATGFYIVDQGKRGVVLRFGKLVETTMPGPRWHMPYPIETVDIVNLEQVRTVEVGYRGPAEGGAGRSRETRESLMLTDDENIIDLQFAVQYNLKSPEDALFNNRSNEEGVRGIAETAIREVVGKSRMDFVLYEGRTEVAQKVKVLMQEVLDRYQSGINVVSVTMQNAQPPEQVQAAFDDAVKAGQDLERQKNEGQAYANDVIPKARGNAARLLEEANGYKQRVINEAEGNASRFSQVLAQYEKAPEVTRSRLYLESQEQILSNTSKVIVDQKSGSGNMLYLPLDKLMGQSGSVAPQAPSASTSTAPSQPSTPDAAETLMRSRDALRSREREARP